MGRIEHIKHEKSSIQPAWIHNYIFLNLKVIFNLVDLEHLEALVRPPRKYQVIQAPIAAPVPMEVALLLNTLPIQPIRPRQLAQVEFLTLLTPIQLLDSPVKILTKTEHLPILIISNLFLSSSKFAWNKLIAIYIKYRYVHNHVNFDNYCSNLIVFRSKYFA